MSAPVLSWLFIAKAFSKHRKNRPAGPHNKVTQTYLAVATPVMRPPGPTLRANPFPEVTDLFCRLPLPTFFYQLEAVHLGDLLRLSVRPDVIFNVHAGFLHQCAVALVSSCPRIFMGRQQCTGQHKKSCCFSAQHTLSPVNLIPGSACLVSVKKKRNLFPGLLPPFSEFTCVAALRREL